MPGEIVGNVSIKVRPDTSKFSEELRAKLKKINDDFKVDVGLDTKGVLAEFKALKKEIEGDQIKANVKVNQKGVAAVGNMKKPLAGVASILENVQKTLNKAAKNTDRMAQNIIDARKAAVSATAETLRWAGRMIKLVTSIENARKAWKKLGEGIDRVKSGVAKIPDMARLARHLSDLAMIGAYIRGIRLINFTKSLGKISTYSNAAKKAMQGLQTATIRVGLEMERIKNIRLQDITNGFKNLGTRVKDAGRSVSSGIGRMLDSGIKGLGKLFSSSLRGMAKAAGNVGGALSKMSKNMLLVAAVAAIVAPALGLISGLIAGLPSLAAAAGAGVAAVALGLQGIKDAASVVTPAIERMKASLAQTFRSGLTPVFKQLNQLMPTLEKGLNKVAKGMIPLAQSFTDVVTSARGMEQVRVILANVGKFFESLQPMVKTFTQSFLTLAEAGSKVFGELSGVLNKFGETWNAMIQRVTANDTFNTAIQGLAKVLGSLLDAFTKIFEAGLKAMGTLGGPVATLIDGFTQAFVALMPILTSVSSVLFEVLGNALKGLAPVFETLAPAIKLIANTLGTILVGALKALAPIIQPIAELLGSVLLAAFQAIQPIIKPLVNLFVELGKTLGGALTEAFIAITPLIRMIAEFIGQLLEAIAPLLPKFLQLAKEVLPPVIDLIKQLMPIILQLAELVFPILLKVIEEAVPIIGKIADILKIVIPFVIKFASKILEFVIPIIRDLLGVVEKVWPEIKKIIENAMKIIEGVFDVVLGVISGDWDRAWDGIKKIVSGALKLIWNVIKGGFKLIVGIFRDLPGAILRALGNLGSLLWGAGKSLIRGLWRGIQSMWGWITGKVSDVVQSIRDYFPFSPAKEGPFSGKGYTTYSGRALVEDWAKGIQDEAPRAVRAVEDMMNAAQAQTDANFNTHVSSDDFGIQGQVYDGVVAAWNDSRLRVERDGFARMVGKENLKDNRR